MNSTPLNLERDGAIARIVFHRPEQLNAIDFHTATVFDHACEKLAQDPNVRVVVIRSQSRSMGAGPDALQRSREAPSRALIEPIHRSLLRLSRMAAPVLASLHGDISGASLSLAGACDLAVASDEATFEMVSEKETANADLAASWHLPHLAGLRHAMDTARVGSTLSAAEARTWGLINWVVPTADLVSATDELAQRLANCPTAALARLKWHLRASSDDNQPAQPNLERDGFMGSVSHWGGAHFQEPLATLLEPRISRFMWQ